MHKQRKEIHKSFYFADNNTYKKEKVASSK